MAEHEHRGTPPEPGHRYQPRHVGQRVFHDVHRTAPTPVVSISRPLVTATPQATTPPPPGQPVMDVRRNKPFEPTDDAKALRQKALTSPAAPRQKKSLVLKRQIVDAATYHQKQQQQERRSQWKAFAFGGIAASLIVTAAAFFYVDHYVHPSAKQPDQAQTLGASTMANSSQANETPVTTADLEAYQVPAKSPRILRIPKLQLVARITPVDVALNGEPLPPSNIYDAGWLTTSGSLGDTSRATLIDGNVVGPTKDGIFDEIGTLGVGDEIRVDKGDGKIVGYKVVQSKQYDADKVDMAEALKPIIAGRPGLNLLTCGGRFNVKTNQFEQRTIIFAAQE